MRSFPLRRRLLVALMPLLLAGTACSNAAPDDEEPGPSNTGSPEQPAAHASFEELESRFEAQLGVYAVDTGSGDEVAWRADERFAFASTIKALAAAAVVDEFGIEGLEEEIPVVEADILPHSPVAEEHVGGSMTLGEVAEAAIVESDNAAGNYLFEALGGPAELDSALADLGDDVTTVSREEPELNEATPGDERDTTTPRAIAGTLREYVLGEALNSEERSKLAGWMIASETGGTLIRAGLPSEWRVGDKSGAGGYGSRSNIAVVWPTDEDPIVMAVLSSRADEDADYDDRLIAEAAEAAVSKLR